MRTFRNGAVELAWNRDASRFVFHTTDPGDPVYLVEPDAQSPKQIHAGARGVHCHFQVWSPDDEYIYFTQGIPPDEMDLWRMKPDGSGAERLTEHNSLVMYPAFLDAKTLVYLATSEEGAGPWLYEFDIAQRRSRRISFGIEQYTSLAASADGRRLVATVERAKAGLWRIPIRDVVAHDADAQRIEVPTVGGLAPRVGPDYLLYVSPKGSGYGIWKLANGASTELASGNEARVVGGAAISPDGSQVAFVEESRRGTGLFVMSSEGGDARLLSGSLEIRGAPAWSPDGKSITVTALSEGARRPYRIPTDGSQPSRILEIDALNPLWSSDGKLLVFADMGVGPTYQLKVVNADGAPHKAGAITLPRGSRRVTFVPDRHALVVLQGEMAHVNFWYIDLDTGEQRQLSDFGREFSIGEFDVSRAGEIVFDRLSDNSDIALIELQGR
jgi:Tol biopolymer transport system component